MERSDSGDGRYLLERNRDSGTFFPCLQKNKKINIYIYI